MQSPVKALVGKTPCQCMLGCHIVAVQTTVAILGVIAKTTTVAVILATMVVILVATLAMRIVTMFPTPMGYRHRVLI